MAGAAEDLLAEEFDHESLTFFEDRETGLQACVAVHSTVLGPAMGGLRLAGYRSISEAAVDALRLARTMSLKTAAADLALGGGKAVLVDDGGWVGERREGRMRAFGRRVSSLGGSYVTAEDVGTTPADMECIAVETDHVAGRPIENGGRGDPSPATADTVFAAIVAAVEVHLAGGSLESVTVGVEGVGHVGRALVERLAAAGADVLVCDLDDERAALVAAETGARAVPCAGFSAREMQVYAPCALGGVITAADLPSLRCQVVAGAANNPLADPSLARRLAAREIVYVPDFVANCGGIIHVGAEPLGFDDDEVRRRVEAAGTRAGELLRQASETRRLPLDLALERATERLRGPGARTAERA